MRNNENIKVGIINMIYEMRARADFFCLNMSKIDFKMAKIQNL